MNPALPIEVKIVAKSHQPSGFGQIFFFFERGNLQKRMFEDAIATNIISGLWQFVIYMGTTWEKSLTSSFICVALRLHSLNTLCCVQLVCNYNVAAWVQHYALNFDPSKLMHSSACGWILTRRSKEMDHKYVSAHEAVLCQRLAKVVNCFEFLFVCELVFITQNEIWCPTQMVMLPDLVAGTWEVFLVSFSVLCVQYNLVSVVFLFIVARTILQQTLVQKEEGIENGWMDNLSKWNKEIITIMIVVVVVDGFHRTQIWFLPFCFHELQ